MSLPNKQEIDNVFFKLASVVALVVLGFSVYHGYSYLFITLRTIVSFVFIYMIGRMVIALWVKLSPPPPKKEDRFRSTFDVLLGNSNEGDTIGSSAPANDEESEQEKSTDDQSRGALRKAYGSKPSTDSLEPLIAGQINTDMKNGLQDAASKAEIGRRMGLEEQE